MSSIEAMLPKTFGMDPSAFKVKTPYDYDLAYAVNSFECRLAEWRAGAFGLIEYSELSGDQLNELIEMWRKKALTLIDKRNAILENIDGISRDCFIGRANIKAAQLINKKGNKAIRPLFRSDSSGYWMPMQLGFGDIEFTNVTRPQLIRSNGEEIKNGDIDLAKYYMAKGVCLETKKPNCIDLNILGISYIYLMEDVYYSERPVRVFISIDDYFKHIAANIKIGFDSKRPIKEKLEPEIIQKLESQFASNESGMMCQNQWLNLFWDAASLQLNRPLTDEEKSSLKPTKSSPLKEIGHIRDEISKLNCQHFAYAVASGQIDVKDLEDAHESDITIATYRNIQNTILEQATALQKRMDALNDRLKFLEGTGDV